MAFHPTFRLLPIAAATVALVGAAPPSAARDVVRAQFAKARDARVAWGSADLNGDGRRELLGYVSGRSVCGSGGCDLVVLTRRATGWAIVARTSVTRLPVRVLPTRHHGWHDLAVAVGGGGMGPAMARLAYDGARYPANPTMAPITRVVGRSVIVASTPAVPLHP